MPNPDKKEKSWFLALFGLPFFLLGAGFFLVSVVPTLDEAWQMSHWQSTQAELLSTKLIRQASSKGRDKYYAEARYQYEVDNRPYQNARVAISHGIDTFGAFQENLGRQLEQAYSSHEKVTVWYDPNDPANAILNREVRWGLLAIKSLMSVIFGGVGFAMIYYGLRGVSPSPDISANVPQPWLNNPDWTSGILTYKGKANLYSNWIFALLWCSISSPSLIEVTQIWQKQGWVALLLLMFPLIGIALLYRALKTTLEWRRFGDTPLRLDPFPGQIGGIVGGDMLLKETVDARSNFKVTLSCLRSNDSGGEDNSRREKLIWHDVGTGRCQPAAEGTRLQFRFAVPDKLPQSETQEGDYHLWRININGKMSGVDLQRNFEIPVYRNADNVAYNQTLVTEFKEQNQQNYRIEDLIPVKQNGLQTDIYYPPFRKANLYLMFLIGGLIFIGIGWFLWRQTATAGFMAFMPGFMSIIFHFLGILFTLGGIYSLFNSLTVSCDGHQVTTVRRLFGIVLNRQSALYSSINTITIEKTGSSSSGNEHTAHYEVHANAPTGTLILADKVDAYSKAEFVADYFRALFILKP